MAKNSKAVSGILFRASQPPPPLFWPKTLFGEKGISASRSFVVFGRHWTDGFFGFWPKSGGGDSKLFGVISRVLFLGQKGAERRDTLFQGLFFWAPFWAPGAKKGVKYRAQSSLFGLFGHFGHFWPKRGPKTPSLVPFDFSHFFAILRKIASRGFWHFWSFLAKKWPILAKNPSLRDFGFFGVKKSRRDGVLAPFGAFWPKKSPRDGGTFS